MFTQKIMFCLVFASIFQIYNFQPDFTVKNQFYISFRRVQYVITVERWFYYVDDFFFRRTSFFILFTYLRNENLFRDFMI